VVVAVGALDVLPEHPTARIAISARTHAETVAVRHDTPSMVFLIGFRLPEQGSTEPALGHVGYNALAGTSMSGP
jgi:hypothetical protein